MQLVTASLVTLRTRSSEAQTATSSRLQRLNIATTHPLTKLLIPSALDITVKSINMKKIYYIVVATKECHDEMFENSEVLAEFYNEQDARTFFENKKKEYTQYSEKTCEDIELCIWSHDDEDEPYYDGELIETWQYDFVGEPMDGKYAMVIFPPKYYSPRHLIIDGDGKTLRYFRDIPQDVRLDIISKENLNENIMRRFGFPEWFIKEPEITDHF